MGVVDAPAWTLPPDQERRLMFTAVGRFLSNVAGPSGTLLILDNLQWIDGDGCDLLATLLRSSGRSPLRIIGAYRDTEADMYSPLAALMADLTPAGLTSTAVMSPLDLADSARLLRSLLDEDQSGSEPEEPGRSKRSTGRAGGPPGGGYPLLPGELGAGTTRGRAGSGRRASRALGHRTERSPANWRPSRGRARDLTCRGGQRHGGAAEYPRQYRGP